MMNMLRRRQRRLVEAVEADPPPVSTARVPVIPITQPDETTSIVVHSFSLAVSSHSSSRAARTGLFYEWHLATPLVAQDGDTVHFNIKFNGNGTAVMTSQMAPRVRTSNE